MLGLLVQLLIHYSEGLRLVGFQLLSFYCTLPVPVPVRTVESTQEVSQNLQLVVH